MPVAASDTLKLSYWTVGRPACILIGRDFETMTFQTGASARRIALASALQIALLVVLASNAAAEKLVDPNAVAPEHREAAEKRRAEQLKLYQCSKKADEAKVLRRDRSAYINECIDK